MGNKNKILRKSLTRKRRTTRKNHGMFGSMKRNICVVGQPSTSVESMPTESKKRKVYDTDVSLPSNSAESMLRDSSPINTNPDIFELVPVVSNLNSTVTSLRFQEAPIIDMDSDTLNNAICAENLTGEIYSIETQNEQTYAAITGRRIIDITYFFNKLKEISNHNALFNCGIQCLTLLSEKRVGLISKFRLKCEMCGLLFYIDSVDPAHTDNVDTNIGAVIGIVSSGIAYSQFEEISSSMNVPIFSERYYSKIQNNVFDKWEAMAAEEMEAAAERERQANIAKGRVKDGIAVIDVYADGCWSARSYGNNYKALSGAAAIIGRKFGEVLFMAVKNKYCIICARAQKKNMTAKEHVCYKNYEGSSTGMEAEIISEGCKHSIEMYNIIYGRLIADGDSATYAKILAQNPYPNTTVVKIECRNHILRNLCNKLRAVSKEVKYPLIYRKLLSDQKVMSIRKVIVSSIKEQRRLVEDGSYSIAQAKHHLHIDTQYSLYHSFGDHRECKDYYCNKEKSLMSAMEVANSTFWFRLKVIIGAVASKSQSLVEDVDTNAAERFNGVIAKIVGGKRVNFSTRRSYQGRCAAAVVTYNNRLPKHTLQKKFLGRSPRSCLKKLEQRREDKRSWNRRNPHKKNRFLNKIENTGLNNDYGENCAAPDMTQDDYETAKKDFLNNLKRLTMERDRIQNETKLQRDCSDWLELRKNMVTASNFGQIIKRRKNMSCANMVKNLLYAKNISHIASIAHGVENEKLALQQLKKQENFVIEACGLFIDRQYPFIGATPDGIIGNDTIVEIKCPVIAFKKGIEEAIQDNKIQLYKYNKKENNHTINRNSNWYFQVQGQLHVTQKNKCIFAIWGGHHQNLKLEVIERDDNFWNIKMEQELVRFYMNCLLPEIVDSRHTRGMPIRDGIIISETQNNVPPRQILANIQPRCLNFSEF